VILKMQLIPAIDLMNGKIVRLTRGEAKTAKIYESKFGTPVEAAKRWRDEGAGKLHIIDLDAAFAIGNNHSVIAEVAENVKLPIQVGGGIRSYETAEKLFQVGHHPSHPRRLSLQRPLSHRSKSRKNSAQTQL
jgi:phosphoribosylformimino-5-aminoimidazole carboxamide ribonucleotide (ProFAR) isomerase